MNMPWQVKIAGKLLLSRIPAGDNFWKRVNLFRLGGMKEEVRVRHPREGMAPARPKRVV